MLDESQYPLVTFALFAYNQEKYIREAVEAAFAQIYPSLEIILSDDGSADDTFGVMQAMADKYTGPHKVRTRRSEINLGTALHVSAVAQMAKGSLIVVAAGDDISLPNRVALLVNEWQRAGGGVATVHSAISIISPKSSSGVETLPLRFPESTKFDLDWYMRNRALPFYSPTCAYSIELFRLFPPLIGGSIIEDGVLSFRTFLKGRFLAVDVPLVKQRILPESAGRGYALTNVSRWNRFVRSRIISYLNKIQDVEAIGEYANPKVRTLIPEFARNARRLSGFIITDGSRLGLFGRMLLVAKIALVYPSSESLAGRLYFGLKFVGAGGSKIVKLLARIFRKFRALVAR